MRELIDLHIHVGGAVAPHVLWSMAHQQGFKLPTKNYWDFVEMLSAHPGKVSSLDDYIKIMHTVTEKIQSSPMAIERSVYEIIGKEYRGSHVTQIELRFNPMKRNLNSELDLDHIIHAALRGMDRACLEYNVKAGLIFCLAREFDAHLNEIMVEKAIKYRTRGVIGIDLAGSETNAVELQEVNVEKYKHMYEKARAGGLKTTVHTGETTGTGAEGLIAAVEQLRPHRIGHGIRAAYDENAMKLLRERNVVLELCPSSNVHTKAVASWDELRHIVRIFQDRKIPLTINTDGPYLLDTDMQTEIRRLIEHEIMDESMIDQCLATARAASFIPVS